jgi:hypothetical protein
VPTIQEQYTEIVKQSQEAALTAVDAWTSAVQDAFGKLPTGLPAARLPVEPNQVIDQYFDFATKLLATQRDFAKNLVHASTSAAETLRQGATQTGEPDHD